MLIKFHPFHQYYNNPSPPTILGPAFNQTRHRTHIVVPSRTLLVPHRTDFRPRVRCVVVVYNNIKQNNLFAADNQQPFAALWWYKGGFVMRRRSVFSFFLFASRTLCRTSQRVDTTNMQANRRKSASSPHSIQRNSKPVAELGKIMASNIFDGPVVVGSCYRCWLVRWDDGYIIPSRTVVWTLLGRCWSRTEQLINECYAVGSRPSRLRAARSKKLVKK